jgi:hypothetical protein
VAYPFNTLDRRSRKNKLRTQGEHIFIGLKGNKIWRFLNIETLKEEVSVDVEFHEYKFPRLNINTNGWPIPRKPTSSTLPKYPRQLEHTVDASRTNTSDPEYQGATRQVLASDRPDIEDIDTQPPGKRVRQSSDLTGRPVRHTVTPKERRREIPQITEITENVQGSSESDPTPGGSSRAVETPNLPGRSEPAPPVAVTRKRPTRQEVPRLEEPIFRPTRSGRIPRKTVFTDSVVQLVSQF